MPVELVHSQPASGLAANGNESESEFEAEAEFESESETKTESEASELIPVATKTGRSRHLQGLQSR